MSKTKWVVGLRRIRLKLPACAGMAIGPRLAALPIMAAGSPAAKTGSAVGAATPGSAVADHELGLVRQAMAYRVKYRVAGGKRQMYLSLLGVHPLNRGGVYP